MKIAILGWGSLLWEEGHDFDKWHEEWQYDGPSLKLEFSRVSASSLGALTLVIDQAHGSASTVAWCFSTRRDPDDAISDLRSREGTMLKNIGWFFLSEKQTLAGDDESQMAILAWAAAKKLDAVVWAKLSSNFCEEAKQPFSVAAALAYVKTLTPEQKVRAAEYVWRAPDFVQTPLRLALQQEPWFSRPGSPGHASTLA